MADIRERPDLYGRHTARWSVTTERLVVFIPNLAALTVPSPSCLTTRNITLATLRNYRMRLSTKRA
jgi:hypothetical protein